MWTYCPHCNHQNDIDSKNLYSVFNCSGCKRSYRGIYANVNSTKNTLTHLWKSTIFPFSTPESKEYGGATACPHCREYVFYRNGAWPSVCPTCHRDLPLGDPSTTPVYTSPKQFGGPDGCGPCTSCGYVFQMYLDRATCPRCNVTMNRDEAFESCSSYPDSTPPENQEPLQNQVEDQRVHSFGAMLSRANKPSDDEYKMEYLQALKKCKQKEMNSRLNTVTMALGDKISAAKFLSIKKLIEENKIDQAELEITKLIEG